MRKLLLIVLAIALGVALTGCEPDTEAEVDTSGAGESSPSAPSGGASAADLEAMPTDGPGESAVVQGLDGSLAEAKVIHEGAGLEWPDMTGSEPVFTAYIIVVDMDGQGTMLEVRADGIPHGLYAYQRPFDAGTLIWSPGDFSSSPRAVAQSEPEKAAVAEVDAAMRDSFPDATYTVSVYGYRFTYVKDGSQVLILEIATDGSVISVGT